MTLPMSRGKSIRSRDIEVINTELLLADLETVEKAFDKGRANGEN